MDNREITREVNIKLDAKSKTINPIKNHYDHPSTSDARLNIEGESSSYQENLLRGAIDSLSLKHEITNKTDSNPLKENIKEWNDAFQKFQDSFQKVESHQCSWLDYKEAYSRSLIAHHGAMELLEKSGPQNDREKERAIDSLQEAIKKFEDVLIKNEGVHMVDIILGNPNDNQSTNKIWKAEINIRANKSKVNFELDRYAYSALLINKESPTEESQFFVYQWLNNDEGNITATLERVPMNTKSIYIQEKNFQEGPSYKMRFSGSSERSTLFNIHDLTDATHSLITEASQSEQKGRFSILIKSVVSRLNDLVDLLDGG